MLADIPSGPDGTKFSRFYDISIPDDMTDVEIPGWLADIFHEAATEQHPDVKRV